MNLIIVESPTKANTFNRVLNSKDYYVFATMGHIRDLPKSKTGIDFKNFAPNYLLIKNKSKVIAELKDLKKKADTVILATDPDREGESIAYHTAYILGFVTENWPDFKLKHQDKLKRIVFHEITKKALENALKNPESLRSDLIKAQQARRILDRIVGYELSPLLWTKMGKNWLSAGRVQTVALRLIVEREKEIRKFTAEEYFQIYGYFKKDIEIKAKLVEKDDKDIEITSKINLFDDCYQFTKTWINKDNYQQIINDLSEDKYQITEVKESITTRTPPPPYTTSLLQQEAFNRFGFSSKMTMKLAQDLYERGLITYHRTDSYNMSADFTPKAKDFIIRNFGVNYAVGEPRFYKTKSKSAQEAHEAIRPTNLDKTAESEGLTRNHQKIYEAILNRAVATQMTEAKIKQIRVDIKGQKNYLFESDYQQVVFDGFLKLVNPKFVSENSEDVTLKEKDHLDLINFESVASNTKPPPRYNEASLIKSLEERGIGRPSTYAPIISLIQDKFYIEKENRYFIPTTLGESISDYLSSTFPQLFDLNFTANMEDNLDSIARGEENLVQVLRDFYNPFKIELDKTEKNTQKIDIEEKVDEKCPQCSSNLIVRYSRYGKFLGCGSFPKCKFTKPFSQFVANKNCPKCNGRIVIRHTKKRKRFYGCENYPKCDFSSWKL